ncbi:uncharacterized protein LOC141765409 [Sebastes fasciatus]|uniref:uncharacterized protein LOC141765409 n=1 Tax=Sebastes fasciatus TaxID=394691 RepID=UPI003D9F2066
MIVTVYIQPSAVAAQASDVIHSTIAGLQTRQPSAFIIVNGDFNHVKVSKTLSNFTQYVTCNTRHNKTLDLLYANIKEAYSATVLPPLGVSDHNLIRLVPTYKPVVRRQWSVEVEEELRECYRSTDWELFERVHGEDIDGLSHCITDYIRFCEESIVPTKKVRCFPNNKPWINGDIKALLNRKKRAFMAGDIEGAKVVQKELKKELRAAKDSYKDRLEGRLQADSSREVFDQPTPMTSAGQPGSSLTNTSAPPPHLSFPSSSSSSSSSPPPFHTSPPLPSTLPQEACPPHTFPQDHSPSMSFTPGDIATPTLIITTS